MSEKSLKSKFSKKFNFEVSYIVSWIRYDARLLADMVCPIGWMVTVVACLGLGQPVFKRIFIRCVYYWVRKRIPVIKHSVCLRNYALFPLLETPLECEDTQVIWSVSFSILNNCIKSPLSLSPYFQGLQTKLSQSLVVTQLVQ